MNVPTAAVGGIALIAAIVLATVGRMKFPLLIAALIQTAVAGLLYGTVGSALHDGATRIDAMFAEFWGDWTGTIGTGLVAFAVVLTWFILVPYHRIVNMKTLGLTAITPLFVNLIPGTFGTVCMYVVGAAPMILGGALNWLFFGHWS